MVYSNVWQRSLSVRLQLLSSDPVHQGEIVLKCIFIRIYN